MSDSVARRTQTVQGMVDAAAKMRALMGGTSAMRGAGESYLPKFDAESDANYTARLNASWLFNGLRKTVKDMVGRVFDKPVELVDGKPDTLAQWCMDVDLEGRDLSTFARQVLEDTLGGPGIGYIMVDAPAREGTVTRAQAQSANLRPFLTFLRIEDVLGWKSETINNVPTLTQFRIWETVREPDPKDEFKEVVKPQVRVLDRTKTGVQVRIFREVSTDKWEQVDEPTMTGMTEITIAPVYVNRTGFMTGAPVLDDLADVNIAHWQSQSDQRNILHFARVPILFAAGRREDEGAIVISASTAVTADDPQADLKWVEHSGQAIGAGRQDLKDLEFQMETHGLQLLEVASSAQSATGAALDAAKETSTLAMTADQLKDALERALAWMCEYGGMAGEQPEVFVNKEFGNPLATIPYEVLVKMTAMGLLSKETLLEEGKRRGVLRGDLVITEEFERIEQDGGELMASGVPGQDFGRQ